MSIDWEFLNEEFVGRLFPREKRYFKMEEFINLRQGNMNALEYFLKFAQLFKYAPSLVSKPRNKMSMSVIDISDHVKEEYRMMMMHDDMNILYLWFMLNLLRNPNTIGSIEICKGVGTIRKVSLGSRRKLQTKIFKYF